MQIRLNGTARERTHTADLIERFADVCLAHEEQAKDAASLDKKRNHQASPANILEPPVSPSPPRPSLKPPPEAIGRLYSALSRVRERFHDDHGPVLRMSSAGYPTWHNTRAALANPPLPPLPPQQARQLPVTKEMLQQAQSVGKKRARLSGPDDEPAAMQSITLPPLRDVHSKRQRLQNSKRAK